MDPWAVDLGVAGSGFENLHWLRGTLAQAIAGQIVRWGLAWPSIPTSGGRGRPSRAAPEAVVAWWKLRDPEDRDCASTRRARVNARRCGGGAPRLQAGGDLRLPASRPVTAVLSPPARRMTGVGDGAAQTAAAANAANKNRADGRSAADKRAAVLRTAESDGGISPGRAARLVPSLGEGILTRQRPRPRPRQSGR